METGRIEHGHYVQGNLKFAVDPKDAHKTFDAVAALSKEDKIALAKANGIHCEPFNKNLLTTILKSVVQNVWFATQLGTVPEEVVKGHQNRLQQYSVALNAPTSTTDFLSKKTRAASKTRTVLLYTIDGAKYEAAYGADHNTWRGQRYLVIKSLLAANNPGGISIKTLFENTPETRETSKPSKNAIGQILNALIAAGIATCINPQDARKKAAPAATPSPKPTVVTVTKKKK